MDWLMSFSKYGILFHILLEELGLSIVKINSYKLMLGIFLYKEKFN